MIMPAEPQLEVGSEKLTKSFFMRLPAATFLASNLFDSSLRSVFAEYVLPLTEREMQWRRICAAGANQRKCRAFTKMP